MRVLLDTVVLIYAVESPERLSNRASVALRNHSNILELSAISLAEIAIKASIGKLAISDSTVRQALEDLDIRVLPYTAEHALRLFDLPSHHGDPFDRQIIAQAMGEKIPVVSPDQKFSLYQGLRIVW
ncbi:MAG: type II toxin-antitoxin system VapC family toxin [Terriglobales bacterium]